MNEMEARLPGNVVACCLEFEIRIEIACVFARLELSGNAN